MLVLSGEHFVLGQTIGGTCKICLTLGEVNIAELRELEQIYILASLRKAVALRIQLKAVHPGL